MVTGKAGTSGTAAITHRLYLNHAPTRLTADTGLTVSLASKLTTTQEENGEAVGHAPIMGSLPEFRLSGSNRLEFPLFSTYNGKLLQGKVEKGAVIYLNFKNIHGNTTYKEKTEFVQF